MIFAYAQNYGQVNIEIDSLEFELHKTQLNQDKIPIYLELSMAHENHNSRKAFEYAQKAYELSVEMDNDESAYETALLISHIQLNLSEFIQAISYAKIAQEYAIKQADKEKIAHSKIALANIYLALFDLEKSVELYYESLALFEEFGNKKGTSRALNGIGIIYHEQENYDKALEFFLNCYSVNKELGDNTVLAAILNNIASSYGGKQDYEKSILYQKEALEINKTYDNKFWEALSYYNLGVNYLSLGSGEESINYFEKAIELAEKIEDFETLANSKNSLAEYYFEINQLDLSLTNSLEAYSIADTYQINPIKSEAAGIAHKSFKKAGDLANAYKYAIIEAKTIDSLKIEKSIQKIAHLELKYLIELEDQKHTRILERKKSQQTLLGIIALFVFIISTIILIAKHKFTVKKMRIERSQVDGKLELRNKELALNVMTLLKKNDMLTSISKELLEVRNSATKQETKDAINKISKKIRKSSETEVWKEFELRFKEVHSEFYVTLKQKFPSLTPGDQRLCALLRLNLASKEIAELTGQNIKALEKARYRLRKKLNLSNSSTNLINFLSDI